MFNERCFIRCVRGLRKWWPSMVYFAELSFAVLAYTISHFLIFLVVVKDPVEDLTHRIFLDCVAVLLGFVFWLILNLIAAFIGPLLALVFGKVKDKARNSEFWKCMEAFLVNFVRFLASAGFTGLSAFLGSKAKPHAIIVQLLSSFVASIFFICMTLWSVNDLNISDCFVAIIVGLGFSDKWSYGLVAAGATLPALKYLIIPYGSFLSKWSDRRVRELAQQQHLEQSGGASTIATIQHLEQGEMAQPSGGASTSATTQQLEQGEMAQPSGGASTSSTTQEEARQGGSQPSTQAAGGGSTHVFSELNKFKHGLLLALLAFFAGSGVSMFLALHYEENSSVAPAPAPAPAPTTCHCP